MAPSSTHPGPTMSREEGSTGNKFSVFGQQVSSRQAMKEEHTCTGSSRDSRHGDHNRKNVQCIAQGRSSQNIASQGVAACMHLMVLARYRAAKLQHQNYRWRVTCPHNSTSWEQQAEGSECLLPSEPSTWHLLPPAGNSRGRPCKVVYTQHSTRKEQ
jgi:hypothetical protein